MSVNLELASAARKVRALNERLPEDIQVEMVEEWSRLLELIEGRSDWQARRLIEEWVETMERRLCSSLLNAPLDPRDVA